MNISCGTPPNIALEQFPSIPLTTPVYRAPLDCSGTLQKGLWPFDADNMSFTVEGMFRDPENPEQNVNAIHLHCVTLELRVNSSGASDAADTEEALACPITRKQRDSHAYSGLELYVCVGTNARLDPYCNLGRWLPVITGACIGEKVTGMIELTNTGRILLRLGGPGALTGCQPRWDLRVDRRKGSCTAVTHGYGNCCQHACANGYRDRQTACKCICPPGFVGVLCDRTSPHLSLSLTVFNSSRTDFWVTEAEHIGKGQTENEYTLTSSLASVLGILPSRVELAYSKTQQQLGTGAQVCVCVRVYVCVWVCACGRVWAFVGVCV